ncbi:MAG: hypothetical protein ABR998_03300 [Gemmatimonadales bacterium]
MREAARGAWSRPFAGAAFAAAVAAVGACGHPRANPSPDAPCRPVETPLPSSASTALMRGDFVVTMVATTGSKAGRSVTGRLSLVPQDSALQAVERATQPLRGTATIALETVGAERLGDLAATAPDAPGVAVYEQRAADGKPTVIVRFGNESNARGPQAFDAGHTTGYVRQITPDGFAGGWSSSAGSVFPPRHADGFFCATRIPLR